MNSAFSQLPIGVFDSGIGGLTVLASLQKQLPQESYIYFGDTARLPYGTKSPETVTRYVLQAADLLIQQKIKLLVIACNTATALALKAVKEHFSQIPIVGVIEPGAAAAVAAAKNGIIAVIATEATVKAQGYQQAILQLNPVAHIIAQGCSLFVALAEEGWVNGPIVEGVAEKYLAPLLQNQNHPIDCLVLGCTHFPILKDTIRKVIGNGIAIIDSADSTAIAVKQSLLDHHLLTTAKKAASARFIVTDSPERFRKVAKFFLQQEVNEGQITWLDAV